MDFELKNFEDKINDITNQFMSLLDQESVIENKVTDKFQDVAKTFEGKFDEVKTSPYEVNTGYSIGNFKFDVDNGIQNPKVGGIAFENVNATPAHAVKLDNDNYADLNKRLEDLYQEKRSYDYTPVDKASVAFSDSNLAAFSSYTFNSNNYTNEKTNSENEKEGYNMANYGFTEDDNSIFSFATVPQERALAPKRSFADVLFMDIPWDTKIDIWGGIKSFLNTEVRITF